MEAVGRETRSEDAISEDTISEDTISEDMVSENMASEDTPPTAAGSPGAPQDRPAAGLAPEHLDRLRFALHRLQECRQLLDRAHDQMG